MPKIIADDAAFTCELQDGIATLRLKKDTLKIATDLSIRDKILNMLDQLEEDPNVLGLIQINNEEFPGEDELGALLMKIIEDAHVQQLNMQRLRRSFSQIVSRNMYFAKPIVTGVIGPMTMEEFGIALMCDRLILSDNCLIKNVGIGMGLPAGPLLTYFLPRIVGPKKALKLLTEEEPLGASEALDMGLVDKVVPEAELEQECRAEVQRLARLPSPVVSATRELIFSQYDKFEEHVDRSIRRKMQILHSAKR